MNSPASPRLLPLLVATTAFEALRAGAGSFRVLIDLPARHRIGPVAFAELSRATDLSTAGIVFYVLYGFGGALLTGATWIAATRVEAPRAIRLLTAVAFVSSLAILLLTTQAAPLMFRIGSSPNDPALLADILDRFTIWTQLRVLCADQSFGAMLAALTILASRRGVAA
jgi:hypothetical protein